MNKRTLIVATTVNNEEKQIFLKPEFPGSNIYHISVDKVNRGIVQKVTNKWIVGLNNHSTLNDQHCGAIISAVSSGETLNN